MVMVPWQRKMWQSLAFFSGDKVYTDVNEESNMGYIRVCDKSAIKLLTSTAITLVIIVGSMNIYVGFPITTSMFSGDLQLPVPVFLPFTDYTTTHGLVLNLINNVFVGGVGLAGNAGIEVITSMLKNTVAVCTDVVEYAIGELTLLLKDPKHQQKNVIKSKFRNILMQVQDYDR